MIFIIYLSNQLFSVHYNFVIAFYIIIIMKSKEGWINLSILNLCVLAAFGLLIRSKMVFDMPFIDYNRLVETHGHFAFMGWATFTLLTLMIYELPGELYYKKIYQFMLMLFFLCSWAILFTSPFESCKSISEYISFFYILLTYVFSWIFIRDILKINASGTVKLLSISSLLSLVLSSVGIIMSTYLFAVKSLNAILYRDAMFGYLHMQYNGFFTLAVFALIYNKIIQNTTHPSRRTIHGFAVMLSLSIIPSMFLTFLWHQTNLLLHILSATGFILLLLSLILFFISAPLLLHEFRMITPAIRYMAVLSISAFIIKVFLQSLTFFSSVNVLVFGNRPMIMGFLHLVFLGFITLFLITYFAQKKLLNIRHKFTRFACALFTLAILFNEILLVLQGLGDIFISGSPLFSWYLWIAAILLFSGALLIAISRIQSKTALQ